MSEEHHPSDLVRYAQRAEEVGFTFASISDHYHPWLSQQGNSSFVWTVLGAVAQATTTLQLGTGVTCPIMRIHPAILAQAAATAAAMLPGRFFFGVGTGENLNEHILGQHWPPHDVRLEMLEEAIYIIRLLWQGQQTSYRGNYFTVENAHLYTLPEESPSIMVAGGGSNAAKLAGRVGDGLVSTAPKETVVEAFEASGGTDKPRYGQLTVCWHEDQKEAEEIAYKVWANTGITGELKMELPTVAHFEQAVKMVGQADIAEKVICGPDPEQHLKGIKTFVEAGFDHVYIHQIGPHQEGFFRFYEQEIIPNFS